MIDDEKNITQDQEILDQVIQESTPDETPEVPEKVSDKPSPEKSFRELREKAERIERERDEAIKRARDIEAKMAKSTQHDEEDDTGLGNEDIAEGRHVKKLSREIKDLKKELNEYKQTTSYSTEEERLRRKYPDIDKVVSKENLEALREKKPALAAMLERSTGSLYEKGEYAYTVIKDNGIYAEDNFEQDRATAQKNAAKPRPLSSVSPQQGESPLSHANAFANGLTEDLKNKLYQEMVECSKRR